MVWKTDLSDEHVVSVRPCAVDQMLLGDSKSSSSSSSAWEGLEVTSQFISFGSCRRVPGFRGRPENLSFQVLEMPGKSVFVKEMFC